MFDLRFYLPRDLIQTRAGFGGRKAWLTDRQVRIAVTRVIRDDISKRVYECVVSGICLLSVIQLIYNIQEASPMVRYQRYTD
jgi:hypothetical protein